MIENKYYVYALLDPRKPGKFQYGEFVFDCEPFYVGKGSGPRLFVHLQKEYLEKSYNPYKSNKIKKIISEGLSPIIVKIADVLLEENAFELEIKAIDTIGMKAKGGPLTNLYEGGCGSSKSEETRQKISATKKQQYASGQVKHWALGKKWSESTRRKVAATKKNNPIKWSDEQKNKLKAIRREHKNSSQTMTWKVVSPDGKEFVVYGLGEFARNHNLCQGHLFSVAKGERKHHKGWKCEYATSV